MNFMAPPSSSRHPEGYETCYSNLAAMPAVSAGMRVTAGRYHRLRRCKRASGVCIELASGTLPSGRTAKALTPPVSLIKQKIPIRQQNAPDRITCPGRSFWLQQSATAAAADHLLRRLPSSGFTPGPRDRSPIRATSWRLRPPMSDRSPASPATCSSGTSR